MVTYNRPMEHELVFKALADNSRRQLLDLLFLKEGRSLSELEEHLPMTRFGVMKHLKVLRKAGLVTTRRSGRETLHYLNAVPIQMVYDRWVSKYSKGWARSLTELKYELEAKIMPEAKLAETTKLVLEVYIRSTPEQIWNALTDGEITPNYYFGSTVESDWRPGSAYKYFGADGNELIDGKVIEADPPKKLVTTFHPVWCAGDEDQDRYSRVTFLIEQMGDACKLRLEHDELTIGDPMNEEFFGGWSSILSGLKTYLETGEPLIVTPKSE